MSFVDFVFITLTTCGKKEADVVPAATKPINRMNESIKNFIRPSHFLPNCAADPHHGLTQPQYNRQTAVREWYSRAVPIIPWLAEPSTRRRRVLLPVRRPHSPTK